MRKRRPKTTKRKAEIANAMNVINAFVETRFDVPSATQTDRTDDRLLDPETTARMLGVSKKTLANWRVSGTNELPYTKVGSRVRYRNQDVRDFLLRQSRRSTTETSNMNSPMSTHMAL